MDFLVELLIEIVGGLLEIFFGEMPLKRLPRSVRFIINLVFWFGLSALFVWLAVLSFRDTRALSVICSLLALFAFVLGVASLKKTLSGNGGKAKARRAEDSDGE
jgi:hypothetical protein